ncbi:IS1595 family transposase [Tundrisphaera sp. TA3]|uniref:IS1595 family transposase n=1 Tax=Tundrisphaera sp. TA3 TaxID=3435775 RepID=UPI003EC093A5
MNIIQIYRQFPTQESCIAHLEKARWGGTPVCGYCGSDNTYPLRGELRHHCNACRKSFSVTIGTIFFDTRLPMQKWFLAISLILNAKKGISSRQLARDLELPVKTAWSVAHRIRKAMGDDGRLLSGIVEMDETYVGGKPRKGNERDDDQDGGNTASRGRGTSKTPVVGMVERKGRVKAKSAKKSELKAADLQSLVRKGVDVGNSVLITDEYRGYAGMSNLVPHKRVNHAQRFADCLVHTNNIESFWAILKRGIVGQFHKVSDKYLDAYLDEFSYRYNGRKVDGAVMFDVTVCRMLKL